MTTPKSRETGRSWAVTTAAIAGLYVLGIGIIVVAALMASNGGGSSATAESAATTVDVSLSEFKISGTLTAPAGEVSLKVTNAGTVQHNLSVEGTGATTKMLNPGESETLALGALAEGSYKVICTVPGHKDSGMTADLVISPAGSSSAADSGDMGNMAGMDHSTSSSDSAGPTAAEYAQMDKDMLASFAKFPAKTKGLGNQRLEPVILPDGTKQFELTAEIADWEVEPGRTVKAWTYNGTVPAPMIKVDVGDRVKVIVHNDLPVDQDVHWHGLETPFAMDGVAPITQEPIAPGADFTYEFTLDRPYMAMYHPHLHGQMAVPNGMFGVFLVGDTPIAKGVTVNGITVPADVKPAVDIPMVLNDSGVIGFSLDGKSFPATAPIVVNEGDWVAVTYYNEGLMVHPMHLHQFPQLVTAQDGFPLESPYWVDTLLVAPGQRYTVMFQATQKGTWVYHCHILNHAERETGMFGMVTAVVVQ